MSPTANYVRSWVRDTEIEEVDFSTQVESSAFGELDEGVQRILAAASREEQLLGIKYLMNLGTAGVSPALVKLSKPQAPEVADLLTRFLARWAPVDRMVEEALNRNASPYLRASLVAALAQYPLENPQGSSEFLAPVFSEVARKDPVVSVRFAAVEALGSVGVLSPEVEAVLREVTASDDSKVVRDEARQSLEDFQA